MLVWFQKRRFLFKPSDHLLHLLIISPKSNSPEVASKSRVIHLPNSALKTSVWLIQFCAVKDWAVCPLKTWGIHGLIDIHAALAQSVRSNKVFDLHFQLFPEDGIDTRIHITEVHMEVSPSSLEELRTDCQILRVALDKCEYEWVGLAKASGRPWTWETWLSPRTCDCLRSLVEAPDHQFHLWQILVGWFHDLDPAKTENSQVNCPLLVDWWASQSQSGFVIRCT